MGAIGNSKRLLDVRWKPPMYLFDSSSIDVSWAAVELLELSTFIFGPKGPFGTLWEQTQPDAPLPVS